jgi:hypothetical protein
MFPPLAVHSNAAPVPNDQWEKENLTAAELRKIQPFLKQIKAMKIQGLSGVGIVAIFIRRQVHPLRERVHYGFEYTGLEDPTRMSKEELSGEVLERIQAILKGVSVIPL